MEKLLEYDPYSGIKTYFSSSGKNAQDWTFRYEFDDVQPHVDFSMGLQNDPEYWRNGVKNDRVHYAHIPDSLLLKWHTEGVNIKNPRALFEMVNRREYSYLKTTNKVHVPKA